MDTVKPASDTVARLLRQLEDQIEGVLVTGALLTASLPDARREQKLSTVVGQAIFDRTARASSAVVEARGHAIAAHRLLERLGQSVDYTVAYGDEHPKPDGPGSDFFVSAGIAADRVA